MPTKAIMNRTFALMVLWSVAVGARADDWPMFMKNPQHTGIAVAKDNSNAVKNLKPSWQYSLHASVSASPVVANNHLLVAAENGNIYSFNLASKELQWLYHTEAGIASTPAVANGLVYFLSRDGFFYALELASGKLAWRFATQGERRFGIVGGYGLPAAMGVVPDPWDLYLSSPLVQDGKVYFGSSDHNVYALDAASGARVWAFKADDSIHSSPTYANNKIFIGTWGSKLYALDAQTGAELWRFQGGTDYSSGVMLGVTASPTVDEHNVYVGSRDGFFYAFSQTGDGKPLWRYDAKGSWVLSTAAIDDKTVYFATSDTGLFVAVDKQSGVERYSSSIRAWSYSSPILVQDRWVFVGTMTGELYAFDKTTGKKLWYYQTPEGRADSKDIIDDKTGALRSDKLFAADKQVQSGVEHVKALGAFVASPIWVDNQLIAVTAIGELIVFTAKGRIRYSANGLSAPENGL